MLRILEPADYVAKPVVSLDDLKIVARTTTTKEDDLLAFYGAAATKEAEKQTGRPLLTQKFADVLPAFPASGKGWRLINPPFVELVGLQYVLMDDTIIDVPPADFWVDKASSLWPQVKAKPGRDWPSVGDLQEASVIYKAGYGDQPGDVPENIRQWIMQRANTAFVYREPIVESGFSTLPRDFVDRLLDEFRLWAV